MPSLRTAGIRRFTLPGGVGVCHAFTVFTKRSIRRLPWQHADVPGAIRAERSARI